MSWYSNNVPSGGITLSTRIRLARNLKGIPFPSRMNARQREDVNAAVKAAAESSSAPVMRELKFIKMSDVPENERYAMVERHIISPEFAANSGGRAVIISPDESICIMLGEEDHIRIQVVLPGLQPEKAYEIADLIDNALCEKLDIAFDKRLGFLTECPTNLGTGLRASVMMHLPMLSANGGLKTFADSASKIGYTVRGMYGEGTKATACFYQISNQITLGLSEKSVIDNLKAIAKNLTEKEKELQKSIDKIDVEDTAMRAYALLKNARIMSSSEMMRLISDLMLGINTGAVKTDAVPLKLFIEGQPYGLTVKYGTLSAKERDIKRAEMLREALN